jgi:hypothetical protein
VSAWDDFVAAREDLLVRFSPPVLVGQGRHDTDSPMFHGNFDWHSCVHAIWALYTLHLRTGEDLFRDAAVQHARPELVDAELEFLRGPIGDEETPYGFAWILALTARREQAGLDGAFRPLAEEGVRRIVEWLDGLDDESGLAAARLDTHNNLSWALIHLNRWAEYTGDDALRERCREEVRRHLAVPERDDAFPLEADAGEAPEFMPTALLRLAAAVQVLPEGRGFAAERVPGGFWIPPVERPVTPHDAGLNVFRAYALWDLFEATNDVAIRENYARLILTQADHPEWWRQGPNDGYRHWVAQIAIRAIDRSYDAEPSAAANTDSSLSSASAR